MLIITKINLKTVVWIYFECKHFVLIEHKSLFFSEILGHSPWSNKTGPNEHVHHVDGWEFHLHLPHHDGGHDVLPADTDTLWDTEQ